MALHLFLHIISLPSRKSYTAAFKLEVIQFAEEAGNRPAERKFGVAEKMVRYETSSDLFETVKI